MKKKLLLMLLLLLLTSGCWNYRELNEMAIVGAVGVDYDYENNLYITTAQVFNAKKNSQGTDGNSSSAKPVTLYVQKAKTIHEALRNMIVESPKKLYIGHLTTLIYGEELLKEKLMDTIDFWFRDAESRKDFIVLAAEGTTAYDVLSILTPLETVPSVSVLESLKANKKHKGSVPYLTFDDVIRKIYQEGKELILPAIKIIGDVEIGREEENLETTEPETKIIVSGAAIFKDNKLTGYISADEVVGYNIITNEIMDSVISFPCDDEGRNGSFEILKIKPKLEVKLEKNTIKVNLNITGKIILSEYNCKLNLKNKKNLNITENQINKTVEKMTNKVFLLTQKQYNSDVIGIGNALYRNYNKEWKTMKKSWNEEFQNAEFKTNCNLYIQNKSSIIDATKEE